MTISSLNALPTTTALTAQTSTDATADTSVVSRAMAKVDARLQGQLDTAGAQLSSFGKLKAAVSDTQLAAKALGALPPATGPVDMKAAAGSFVKAFNAAIVAAKATAQSGASSAEAGGARRAGTDLSRTVGANASTVDALKKLGIKLAADGTLTMNATTFDAATRADPTTARAALAGVGQSVDKTASTELAEGGQVAASIVSLSQRFTTLYTHQKAVLTMQQNFATTQGTSSASTSTSTPSTSASVTTALTTYLQNR